MCASHTKRVGENKKFYNSKISQKCCSLVYLRHNLENVCTEAFGSKENVIYSVVARENELREGILACAP